MLRNTHIYVVWNPDCLKTRSLIHTVLGRCMGMDDAVVFTEHGQAAWNGLRTWRCFLHAAVGGWGGGGALFLVLHDVTNANGLFPGTIHEMMSPRWPRPIARHRCAGCDKIKISTRSRSFSTRQPHFWSYDPPWRSSLRLDHASFQTMSTTSEIFN